MESDSKGSKFINPVILYRVSHTRLLKEPKQDAPSVVDGRIAAEYLCRKLVNRVRSKSLIAAEAKTDITKHYANGVSLALDISRQHEATRTKFDTGTAHPAEYDSNRQTRVRAAILSRIASSRKLRHVASDVLHCKRPVVIESTKVSDPIATQYVLACLYHKDAEQVRQGQEPHHEQQRVEPEPKAVELPALKVLEKSKELRQLAAAFLDPAVPYDPNDNVRTSRTESTRLWECAYIPSKDMVAMISNNTSELCAQAEACLNKGYNSTSNFLKR